MKDEYSLLLVTSLVIAIIASIFCASEWLNGNQESALILTAGTAIAIPFYAVVMVLRQIKKNQNMLEERLRELEEKIEQREKQEEVYVQFPTEH